jgi:6-phosphogluconolactonase
MLESIDSSEQICRWHAVADQAGFLSTAAQNILSCAEDSIRERGQFLLVLAGGSTPERIYRALCISQADWPAWHIYFGDERCLPTSHPERNSTMAKAAWLDQVPVPPNQIHLIPGEQGPAQGALAYAQALHGIGTFDLVLLGLGEDGHTASLFPDHDWGSSPSAADALAIYGAPKPPPERISLSATRLSRARKVLFLVSGASKQQAVTQWREGADIPARSIRPPCGVDILVESALLDSAPSDQPD